MTPENLLSALMAVAELVIIVQLMDFDQIDPKDAARARDKTYQDQLKDPYH